LPPIDQGATAAARFKVPARVNNRQLGIYTIYARHIANLALEATPALGLKPVPLDPTEVVRMLRTNFGDISLSSVVRYIWSLGIVVLSLDDPGGFHGACWRVKGRNVIVLKQQTRSNARWLFDLLHELWHAGQEPEMPERTILELSDAEPERSDNDEERKASRFAGSVSLEGRAEELVSKIVQQAKGDIARFKSVLPRVAAQEHVSVGALANYLAFRLSLQHENWWGAASNLQTDVESPLSIVRDVFLDHADFSRLGPTDREIMTRALSDTCAEVK
jgi:Zn-dependent peptidase ImmA (M78 family)